MKEGVKMMSEDKDFVLLDVRRPDEFAKGHIPGAVLLTNETMTEEKAAAVIKNKDQKIYVYCYAGRRSKIALQKLDEYGYTNIIEIGGITDYTGELEVS
ncbi:MAG: rhodanese-like domain-containing protein [Treponema sp.]|nr:rhodanese-like domain-containing protein [Treponema sp.]